jgi:hypothetical protein
MDHKHNFYTGLSSIISQLTGQLFFDNVKMEKQRTNLSYKHICSHMLKKNYINGFFPYGVIQSFGKGYIVSYTKIFLEPKLQHYEHTKKYMIIGFLTGIAEALFLSPIMMIRNHLNENLMNNNNNKIKFNSKSFVKGVNGMIIKRCLDWTSRYLIIDEFNTYSPIKNDIFNIFVGSGLSTVISTPVDRMLPLIFSHQPIKPILQSQGISFFYKGLVFRFISTGYYTSCIFLIPPLIKKYI